MSTVSVEPVLAPLQLKTLRANLSNQSVLPLSVPLFPVLLTDTNWDVDGYWESEL